MELLQKAIEKIESFKSGGSGFRDACAKSFREADRDNDGKITGKELVETTQATFHYLQSSLKEQGIKVIIPKKNTIMELLSQADGDENGFLDEKEYTDFYERLLKLSAYNGSRGFFVKHIAPVLAAVGSAVVIYIGQLKAKISDDIKPFILAGTPVIAIAVGTFTNKQLNSDSESEAIRKILATDGFKLQKKN